MQRQLLQQNIPKAVAESDVVIANPTHFAVALKYDTDSADTPPKVNAKGEDNMAKNSFLGGVVKFTVAAAAVSGICYLFRDDLKSSKTYQKYDVDEKISKAKTVVKDKTATIKDKAATLKEKAPWANKASNDDVDEAVDEVVRDYVEIDTDDAVEEAADKVDEAAEEVADKAEDIISAVTD